MQSGAIALRENAKISDVVKPYQTPMENATYDVNYSASNAPLKGEMPETRKAREKISNYAAGMSDEEKKKFAVKLGITYWKYGESEARRMINNDKGTGESFLDSISKIDLLSDPAYAEYLNKRSNVIFGFLNDADGKKE